MDSSKSNRKITAVTADNPSSFQPQAHRSLFIPEFLVNLFKHLSWKDIRSATLVCRAWQDLATDALWRVHPVSVALLMKFLRTKLAGDGGGYQHSDSTWPPDASGYDKIVEIPDDVTPTEWHRFLHAFNQIQWLDEVSLWASA
ncbi:hypothetical protein FRC02_001765, partial [Tulasnella sp. 418]